MKFFMKDFFSKCDQIRKKVPIWSHLLKKSLMENIFGALLCTFSWRSTPFHLSYILFGSMGVCAALLDKRNVFPPKIVFIYRVFQTRWEFLYKIANFLLIGSKPKEHVML